MFENDFSFLRWKISTENVLSFQHVNYQNKIDFLLSKLKIKHWLIDLKLTGGEETANNFGHAVPGWNSSSNSNLHIKSMIWRWMSKDQSNESLQESKQTRRRQLT